MEAFYDDPEFTNWLAKRKPRDELIVRLALRDRIRDPATGLAWAARIKMLEDAMTPAEYEEALANVGRVARELARTMPANDDRAPPTGRRGTAKKKVEADETPRSFDRAFKKIDSKRKPGAKSR